MGAKRCWLLWLALLPGLPVSGEAPSVEEVLRKYAEAHGGLESWGAVESLKITGTYTAFSEAGPFTLFWKRPNLYQLDHQLGSKRVLMSYDGETAWWVNPWYGLDWPVKVPGVDAKYLIRDAELESPLLNPAREGYEIELRGRTELEGQEVLELAVTRAGESLERWFLDPETFLEVAWNGPVADFGQEVDCWTFFSDFRSVGGVVIPHSVESEFGIRHRVTEIESVEINPEIDEQRFRFPPPPAMKSLRAMVGHWRVEVESRSSSGAAWQAFSTASTITSLLGGSLLEERLSVVPPGGTPTEVVRLWSYDRFEERFRVAQIDDFTSHLNVLEGRLEEGRLTVDNLQSDTPWRAQGVTTHERFVASDIGPSGFRIEAQASTDGGESWETVTFFTYRRQED